MRTVRILAAFAAFALLAACSDLGPTGIDLADDCAQSTLVQCGYIGSDT